MKFSIEEVLLTHRHFCKQENAGRIWFFLNSVCLAWKMENGTILGKQNLTQLNLKWQLKFICLK